MSVAALAVLGLGIRRHNLAGRGMIPFQPRASQVFQPGSAVVHRVGVALAEVPSGRPDLVSLGYFTGLTTFTASSTADANGGAVDPVTLQPQTITIHPFDRTGFFASGTGADVITAANIDEPCFWSDDNTLCLTDAGGTRSFAGYVEDVPTTGPDAGGVVLRSNLEIRALYELYSAGQATQGLTDDVDVRAVATSLPAGSFSGGVYTATSNGAFSTAQDGVTLAAGDKINIPAGTIGSLTVTAANSGPYEVTSLGSASSKLILTRPARWAHGDGITPMSVVRVGGEGTLFAGTRWYATPATAAKVVGTDDPILYPDRVTQQITLESGTKTISNVPIKSTSKSMAVAMLAGGTPAATTTGYDRKLTSGAAAGGIGTGQIIIEAQSVKGTIVNTDVSVLNVTIFN